MVGAEGSFVSTVKVTVVLAWLVPPSASWATALTVATPFARAVEAVTAQVPDVSVVVATSCEDAPVLSTTVKVTALVVPPAVATKEGVALVTNWLAVGAVITGAAGSCVSMTNDTAPLVALAYPSASVATAVAERLPSERAADVPLQVPLPLFVAFTVTGVDEPSVMVTTTVAAELPAVMVNVGVDVVRMVPADGAVMTGVEGCVPSMVNATALLVGPASPSAFVATAVAVACPSVSALVGVADQVEPLPVAAMTTGVSVPTVTVTATEAAVPPVTDTAKVGVSVVTS
jgi:hypothetical protein